MTNEATDHEASDIDHSATGHSCAHCDSAEDHHAVDVKGIVDSFRSTLRGAAIARIAIAAVALVAGLIWAPVVVAAGAAAWFIATLAGLGVVTATRGKYGTGNALVLGTVASAAIMPITAWLTSMWAGGSWSVAVAGAAGWFFAVMIVESLRDRKLSALLIADTRDGEAAREGVLFGNPISPWVGLGWSVSTALFFGLWIWVTGLLPLAVIPLIPLQVALAILSRKGNHAPA